MQAGDNAKGEVSPYDTASYLAHITFDYVRPLLRLGATKPLMHGDLPPSPARDQADVVVDKVQVSLA